MNSSLIKPTPAPFVWAAFSTFVRPGIRGFSELSNEAKSFPGKGGRWLVVLAAFLCFICNSAKAVSYSVSFQAPQVVHLQYSLSPPGQNQEVIFFRRTGGSDTEIARASSGETTSGTFRVPIGTDPISMVERWITYPPQGESGPPTQIEYVYPLAVPDSISGRVLFDEEMTLVAPVMILELAIAAGRSLSIIDTVNASNPAGFATWSSVAIATEPGSSLYFEGATLANGGAVTGAGTVMFKNCNIASFGSQNRPAHALGDFENCRLGGLGLAGQTTVRSCEFLYESNPVYDIELYVDGKLVITDSLFNVTGVDGTGGVYLRSVSGAMDFEMSGSEVCGGFIIASTGSAKLESNTFYRGLSIQATAAGLQATIQNNTILGGLNDATGSAAILQNYYGARTDELYGDNAEGWLSPFFNPNGRAWACQPVGQFTRSSLTSPRNLAGFRAISMAAGHTSLIPSKGLSNGSNGGTFYLGAQNAKIRAGKPFAMVFDLKSWAERLPGVSYRLEMNSLSYLQQGTFTAIASRDEAPVLNSTLNFKINNILVSGTYEWKLHADFSGCTANIVKPGEIEIARGQILVSDTYSRHLRIGVVELALDPALGYNPSACPQGARAKVSNKLKNDLLTKLPLVEGEISMVDLGSYLFDGGFLSSWTPQWSMILSNQISNELQWYLGEYNVTTTEPLDFIVVVAPTSALGGADGTSMPLRRPIIMVDESTPDAAIHELGHGMGLYTAIEQYNDTLFWSDTYTPSGWHIPGTGLDIAGESAYNSTTIADPSVPPGSIRHLPACRRNEVIDIMGAKGPQWIVAGTYRAMSDWLDANLGITGQAQSSGHAPIQATEAEAKATVSTVIGDNQVLADPPVLSGVTRFIHIGGVIKRQADGDMGLDLLQTGSVRTIELKEANSATIFGHTYALPLIFVAFDSGKKQVLFYPLTGRPRSDVPEFHYLWHEVIEVPVEAVQYKIFDTRLMQYIWSSSALPEFTSDFQVDYHSQTGHYDLAWSASNSSAKISHTLMVSGDNGNTWSPRPLPSFNNTMSVSVGNVGISQPRFKLVSSDGFRAVESAASQVGVVAVSAPVVEMMSPTNLTVGESGATWTLMASVWDPDGDLQSVAWSSDRDGALGASATTSAVLSDGQHTLTVTAMDAGGRITNRSVAVTVGTMMTSDLTILPSDIRIPVRDGGMPENAIVYGQSNAVEVRLRNHGISNRIALAVHVTKPGESEALALQTEVDLAAFETKIVSVAIHAAVRGEYTVRAVCTPLDIPDPDPSNNAASVSFINFSPQVTARRIFATPQDLPLSIPLLARDPNGDTVTLSLEPSTVATLQSPSTLVFDNGGAEGTHSIQIDVTDPDDAKGSAAVIVTVRTDSEGQPLTVLPPAPATGEVGGSAQFAVQATGGQPPLTYRWQRAQTDVVNGMKYAGVSTATLTVNNLQLADSGALFRVVVTDSVGETVTSDEVSLSVNSAPLAVTQAATFVSATSATVAAEVNAFGLATNVQFLWGLSATALNNTLAGNPSLLISSALAPVTGTLLGLQPNKTYYYRVSAQNSVGSILGAIMSFKTPAARAPTVTTLAATGITSSSAVLQGKVNPRGGEAFVRFDYGLTTSYDNGFPADPPFVDGNTEVPVSAAITGLLPHTKYNFRVFARGDNGDANGSNLTFTTLNNAPSASPDIYEARPRSVLTLAVLANDTDPDGDLLSLVSFTAPPSAAGKVAKVGNHLVFTTSATFPAAGISFSYTMKDGFGGTDTASVTINSTSATLDPVTNLIASAKISYPVTLTTEGGWSAVESLSWVSVAPVGGYGDGTVTLTVLPNTAKAERKGTIFIAGLAHSITQQGVVAPQLMVPDPIPEGIVGGTYRLVIPTLNAPVTYTATNLPRGLSIDQATGTIVGRPTEVGTKRVVIKAINAAIKTPVSIDFDIKINPFPIAAGGTFSAFIDPGEVINQNLGGYLSFTSTPLGVLSGKLKLGGRSQSFKGTWEIPLSGQGTAQILIPRKGVTPLSLNLVLYLNDRIRPDAGIDGTLSEQELGGESVYVFGYRHAWPTGESPAAYAGSYTATMGASLDPGTGEVAPAGPGYLMVNLTSTGLVTWSGKVADGTAITGASYFWPDTRFCLFQSLYAGKGSVLGDPIIQFPSKVLVGAVRWLKKPQLVLQYPNGIETDLVVSGNAYTPPEQGFPVIGLDNVAVGQTNAQVQFAGGDIESATQYLNLTQFCRVTDHHVATFSPSAEVNPISMKITTLNAKTGYFKGSFTLKDRVPIVSRRVSFEGVLDSVLGTGAGFFRLSELPAAPTTSVAKTVQRTGTVYLLPSDW